MVGGGCNGAFIPVHTHVLKSCERRKATFLGKDRQETWGLKEDTPQAQ